MPFPHAHLRHQIGTLSVDRDIDFKKQVDIVCRLDDTNPNYNSMYTCCHTYMRHTCRCI